MKNGLTKFVLLIDYHGEYSIKLDNEITKKYIYENVDNYELIFSPLACEIPTEIIEPLQPENNNLKEEIERLKQENESMLRYGCLQKEHNKNNVSYLEERILNLENKLSVQDDLISELQEQEKISIDLFCDTSNK